METLVQGRSTTAALNVDAAEPTVYRIRCAEIWGGIRDEEQDVCSAGLVASLYSRACEGGKGGDIYYLSVCEKDNLTRIAVADVVGHGSAVSEVSEWLYHTLEERMNDTAGNDLLADLNRSASARGIEAMTTAAVVGFYTADSNFYYSYAGHTPALLRRASDNAWRRMELDANEVQHVNAPLGVLSDCEFDQQHVPLTTGDRVLLYTDGLVEAPNEHAELFGEARLRNTLDEAAAEPLPELKRAVLEAVRKHANGDLSHDDVTLLAIEAR